MFSISFLSSLSGRVEESFKLEEIQTERKNLIENDLDISAVSESREKLIH